MALCNSQTIEAPLRLNRMMQPLPEHTHPSYKGSQERGVFNGELTYQGTYLCPVCRHGHISGLTLMDAFACNFCRHIFTANLQDQSVQVVDSSQPMAWRWTGRRWQVAYQDDPNLTFVIWAVGSLLVVLPFSIVWLATYTFPPLPGSAWAWFPTVWASCTLFVHLFMVTWVMVEHYQFPAYIAGKVWIQNLLRQR